MTHCSRCGAEIGSAATCPHCGGGPSQSVLEKGGKKVARTTGVVLEKSVDVSEKVYHEAKPVVKGALNLGKKGLAKAKKETLKAAKTLKEEGK